MFIKQEAKVIKLSPFSIYCFEWHEAKPSHFTNMMAVSSIDRIKIDQTFIRSITPQPASISIITAMIALAKNLGIKVIAEGVETQAKYEFSLEQGCMEMQGARTCF